MCGITGVIAFSTTGQAFIEKIEKATACLVKRGPDAYGIFKDRHVAFGHRRLSIIDTSEAGRQPMTDLSGNFTIVFNGEFFNYREHRDELIKKGIQFRSESDTEVLLQLFILEGPDCLKKVNGFFALAIYNHSDQSVFISRDRFGVKPLYYFRDDDKFIFASEMKAILAFGIQKVIDKVSLYTYLQLNYIPAPRTILKKVSKLEPSAFMMLSVMGDKDVKAGVYYTINGDGAVVRDYEKAKSLLYSTLENSVERRLVSDVPLGAFLSGGIDSSVVVGLASKLVKKLNTFSVGFKDEPLFDETQYALLVAGKFETEHTVFSLTNDDLFNHLFEILDYTDEPFADSSAIAVYILSRETRKHVTVALSGDGADEIFAGYNKYRAEWMIRNNPFLTGALRMLSPLTSPFNGSRNSKVGNRVRQVNRFVEGSKMNAKNRYWRWCSFVNETDAAKLMLAEVDQEFEQFKDGKTGGIGNGTDFNNVLLADVNMVLPDDMLTKVDRMSMANSLEVRTPFLDYEVVDLAFSLPAEFKIDKSRQKKILKDTFSDMLPPEIFHRGKQGFEVPLLNWFRTGLKTLITQTLLDDKFITEQKIFNPLEINKLKLQLFSDNPGEIHARIWGLVVFQYWYRKYFQEKQE